MRECELACIGVVDLDWLASGEGGREVEVEGRKRWEGEGFPFTC